MNKTNEKFRDKLLALEKTNPTYKEKYETEIKKMLEKKISISGRVGVVILAAYGILSICAYVDLLSWALPSEGISNTVTYGFVLSGFVLAITFTLLTVYLVIFGKFGSRIKPSLIIGLGAAMSFFLVVAWTFFTEITLLQINPQDWRVKLQEQLAVAMFFIFVFIGLYLILRVLYRLEFKTREKLLEIELRIADLAEKMENQQSQENIRNQ